MVWNMPKKTSPLLVLLAALAMVCCFSSPASAASYKVTIKKIPTKTAKYKSAVKVWPSVATSGTVKVSSKRLTVKKGKKAVRKNATFASLKAGKYKVTTTVKYRPYTSMRKSRTVNRTVSYDAYDKVPSLCVVTSIDDFGAGTGGFFDAACTANGSANATFAIDGFVSRSGQDSWEFDTYLDPTVFVNASSIDALVGQELSGTFTTEQSLSFTKAVVEQYTAYAYGKVSSKSASQSLTIKQGKKPKKSTTASPSGWNCPARAPIKGNASSHIYHLPGGAYYNRTKPEICFATQAAARQAGYRASMR